MPRIFPSIPTEYLKSVKLPGYNTKINEFPDGGEIRIQLSTIGVGTKLNLTFENLSETLAASLMNFYAYCEGEGYAFLLPSSIINHPQSIKDAIAALKATTYWTFEGQPKIEPKYSSGQRGLFRCDLTLSSVVS